MTSPRYPTIEEFWARLDARETEDDLKKALRERTERELRPVTRVGDPATVRAVVTRILPCDVPPDAIASFIDEVFDQQLGRADDPADKMPREEMVPAGFRVVDEEARKRHGRAFAELEGGQQDEILETAEKGNLKGPGGWDSGMWFQRVRSLCLLAFGSDPRGMVQMGFPGPSYKTGHIWLTKGAIKSRAARKKGFLKF